MTATQHMLDGARNPTYVCSMSEPHPLRAWREAHGVTADDIAAAVGVSSTAVYAWELGERKPRVEHAAAVESYTRGAVRVADLGVALTPEIVAAVERASRAGCPFCDGSGDTEHGPCGCCR
jgi:DNA-binding XRE family transcriptional regulator